MLIPEFAKKKKKKGRMLSSDLSEIDVSTIFETGVIVRSDEKKSQLNYFMQLKEWEVKHILLQFDFKQPLAVSRGFENDEMNIKIKESAKSYFISAETYKPIDINLNAKNIIKIAK